MDCGTIINRDTVKAQVEVRMNEAPPIEVHPVSSRERPAGS